MQQKKLPTGGKKKKRVRCILPVMANNRIHILRKQRGFTLGELGELVGVTSAQISRWETGEREFPSYRVWQLAKALRVHPGELFAELPATGVDDETQIRAAEIARKMNPEDRARWFTIGSALVRDEKTRLKLTS